MAKRITPFLMFEGKAEEAMGFYTSIFPGSEVVEMTRYGPGEMGTEGSVKVARFRLVGREFAAIDSPVQHGFTFTPAFSLFVDFEAAEELDAAYARLNPGFRQALFIYATVVSTSGERVVTDAGMKSCATDQGAPVYEAYPGALVSMSEEHAAFPADPEKPCRVGDRLRAIPGHGCTTVNLHEQIYIMRGGVIEGCMPVTSRGKSR